MHPLNGVRKNLDGRQIASKTEMSSALHTMKKKIVNAGRVPMSKAMYESKSLEACESRQLAAQLTPNKSKKPQPQSQLNKMGHKTHITTRKAVELNRMKYYEHLHNPYSKDCGTNLLQI